MAVADAAFDMQTGAVQGSQGAFQLTASATQLNGQTYQSYDFNRDGQLDLLVQQAVVVNMH